VPSVLPLDSFRPPAPGRLRRVRGLLGRAARAGAGALGQDLVKREFYSPVPHPEELPAEVFERRSPLRGIDFALEPQLSLVRGLAPHIEELSLPAGFFENIMYKPVETELLYALLRRRRPGRVIELGSGYSSLVIGAACRRNAEDGDPARYVAYDPYPQQFVSAGVDGLTELRSIPASEAPVEDFERLEQGDVLFVDSTHTVKLGSEVNHIVLNVLPSLSPGVMVHFHDIFLPYEYPREYSDAGLYFAEQYLVHAFLACNPEYAVRLATYGLARDCPAEIASIVPSLDPGEPPTALWIERI